MEFIEREVQFPNRKKLTKISENGNEVVVDIENQEGTITVAGTQITADVLNKGNWRDDKSVSFEKLTNNNLPVANEKTQIVTKADGSTWVIPPQNLGNPKEIGVTSGIETDIATALNNANTANINANNALNQLTVVSNAANSAAASASAAMSAAQVAQQAAEEAIAGNGTIINVNSNPMSSVNFTADPQTQINAINTTMQNAVFKSELFNLIYPVGSIYTSVSSTNPHNLFGGTWVAWGQGRVPVGVGSNGHSTYSTPETVGGSETSVAAHHHTSVDATPGIFTTNISGQFAIRSGASSTSMFMSASSELPVGAGVFSVAGQGGTGNWANSVSTASTARRPDIVTLNSNHNHTQSAHNHLINSAGSVNGNMQPYITCYMWKRTN
ncbi:MAG: hypothetical protein FWD32_01345 [Firmicutes bacterium]|nr:hypothetical protein [Bacillota bacterium]